MNEETEIIMIPGFGLTVRHPNKLELEPEEGEYYFVKVWQHKDGEPYEAFVGKPKIDDPNVALQEEYVQKMQACVENKDAEMAHSKADELLCEVLKKLGFSTLVEKYEKVERWYA